MKTITISHPFKEISITEKINTQDRRSESQIRARWKQRYGKLYDHCEITVYEVKKEIIPAKEHQIKRPPAIYTNKNFNAA